jgi:hypothetical protein
VPHRYSFLVSKLTLLLTTIVAVSVYQHIHHKEKADDDDRQESQPPQKDDMEFAAPTEDDVIHGIDALIALGQPHEEMNHEHDAWILKEIEPYEELAMMAPAEIC